MGGTNTKLVVLALGANVDAEDNISKALKLLQLHLASMHHSTPIWTLPIGIQSDNFLNCVVMGQYDKDYEELRKLTKKIEQDCGNTLEKRRSGKIAMDIDILLYNKKKYHPQDWKRQYIIEGIEKLSPITIKKKQ